MKNFKALANREAGFSFAELVAVLAGSILIMAIATPALRTALDSYRLTLGAENLVTELQYARMKSVASNESFNLSFPSGTNYYQVTTSTGAVTAGPFYLPSGISWNTVDGGTGVTFPGTLVTFLPTGNLPASGNGSAGRAKIVNRSGVKIDIVVSNGGIIRQTPTFTSSTPPF